MTEKEALTLYKMVHFLAITSEYAKSLQKTQMNLRVKNIVDSIPLREKQLKNELKKVFPGGMNELFPDLTNDKPFLYMDLFDKCLLLDENQMKDLVDGIEIVQEDEIVIEEVLKNN